MIIALVIGVIAFSTYMRKSVSEDHSTLGPLLDDSMQLQQKDHGTEKVLNAMDAEITLPFNQNKNANAKKISDMLWEYYSGYGDVIYSCNSVLYKYSRNVLDDVYQMKLVLSAA